MDSVRVGNRSPGGGYEYRALSTRVPITSPYSRTIASPYSRRVTSPYSETCFAGSRIQRPALQAAGYICSPWRTRDHGFDRVLFLCRRREGDYYSLLHIGADFDTELKSTAAIEKEKTYVLQDGNIITAAERFRFTDLLFVAHSAHLRRLHSAPGVHLNNQTNLGRTPRKRANFFSPISSRFDGCCILHAKSWHSTCISGLSLESYCARMVLARYRSDASLVDRDLSFDTIRFVFDARSRNGT